MPSSVPINEKEIKSFYDRKKDEVPFEKWKSKQESTVRKIIDRGLLKVKKGNYGDFKHLGGGVIELRFRDGYRIYFTEISKTIVLLFYGGDKSDQQKDIDKAREYRKILSEKGLDYCLK
ncbi:hypothetical protein FACS1894152_4720 [Bacilli bacterium]|nr:hypothetical protein FACS1894152_4720 [Bacilli bacterium]